MQLTLKKLISGLCISVFAIFLIYSLAWFIILQLISTELNKQYANNGINTQDIGTKESHIIKFSHIEPCGFPFKISLRIFGWSEDSNTSKINFTSPIYVGYDLLKQHMFTSFSGEIIAKYKPVQSGFGSRFKIGSHEILIKYPITSRLIKNLIYKKNIFELVNFIKSLELKSRDIQIFDLIDQTKLYDEDYTYIKLSINKHKYYTSLSGLLNQIPQRFDIIYSTSVVEPMPLNRIVPRSLLFNGAIWNFAFKIDSNFYIKSNNLTLTDFNKDFEIGVLYLKSSSEIHSSLNSLFYSKKIDNFTTNLSVKLASQIELKNDFAAKVPNFLKYLTSDELRFIVGFNYDLNNDVKDELQYIINNTDKFDFKPFGNKKYECELDLNVIQRKSSLYTKINNFSIFSGETGVRLRNNIDLMDQLNLNINGLILLNNYPKILDLLSDYLYRLGKYKTFSEKNRNVYNDTLKSFLHSISDYPDSNSKDISLDYKIDFSNPDKGKIGSSTIDKLKSLYHLTLYQKAIEAIKINNDSDNIINLIIELAPTFSNNPKLLEKLIKEPTKIDKETWEEIIK